ncbi:MAG: HNH endonuclease [Ferruginibacter sp.]|nr:HNH endonuclease [Ferruginibacter sp.]
MTFNDSASEFYQFMTSRGYKNTRTKSNYLSWLKFLSQSYVIDNTLNALKIDNIVESEKIKRKSREKYTREKDISDFKSALKKYLEFIESDFEVENNKLINKNIEDVETDKSLSVTEKNAIILSRVGQGNYRKSLINYWESSSINKYNRFDLLIASHIKPWKDSSNIERIDLYNGLLLPPNYDKLFDKGYISFNKKGNIEFSKFLNADDKFFLGINTDVKLIKTDKNHIKYLEYHIDSIFLR